MDYFRGLATGLLIGALAMFVVDPQRRRRARARSGALQYGSDVSEWRASRQRAVSRRL